MTTGNSRIGRPTLHTKKIEDKICELLACGYSLRRISRRKGMPSKTTIMNWLRKAPYFLDHYADAKLWAYNFIKEETADYVGASVCGNRKSKRKARQAMFQIMKQARNILPRANTPDRILRNNYKTRSGRTETQKVMLPPSGEYYLIFDHGKNKTRQKVRIFNPPRKNCKKPCVDLLTNDFE